MCLQKVRVGLFGHLFARYRMKYCLKEPLNPRYYQQTGSTRHVYPKHTSSDAIRKTDQAHKLGKKQLKSRSAPSDPPLCHESGRVVRRCWVNFQCRGVLRIWIIIGQGPIALAVGAGGGLFGHFFSHLSLLFSFSLSLGDDPIYTEILSVSKGR